jgi:hypothetical protein
MPFRNHFFPDFRLLASFGRFAVPFFRNARISSNAARNRLRETFGRPFVGL